MSVSVADYAWLPDHQMHVVATLAHVDQTIERAVRLIHQYTEPGPLALQEVVDGDQVHLTVTAIAPLPEAIPRLIADALTQLRAALEHTLYAEIQHQTPRPLTDPEARSIEMPAFTNAAKFDAWLNHRWRKQVPALQSRAPLTQRIRSLQPFQQGDADNHPLRLPVEYTNLAKHRTPAVAATRLGAVHPDYPHPDLEVAVPLKLRPGPGDGLPLQAGDILAKAPRDLRVPLSITPAVGLERPHTSVWNIAARELEDLEQWVRTTAVPILITGTPNVTPIPPQLDIAVGHEDLRRELPLAGTETASDRARQAIGAAVARAGLVDILSPLAPAAPDVLSDWLSTMSDTAVSEWVERLAQSAPSPIMATLVAEAMLAEFRAYVAASAVGAG